MEFNRFRSGSVK